MKNRSLPYGYVYKAGEIGIEPKESEVVAEVYRTYLAGEPLSVIAGKLNGRGIEYMPGIIGWNKPKVKRILEENRYLGAKGFPQIIEKSIYDRVQELKSGKGPLKNKNKNEESFRLMLPVLCPHCHEPMQRKRNNRLKNKVKWKCANGHAVFVDDEKLLSMISETLRTVTENPAAISAADKENPETAAPMTVQAQSNNDGLNDPESERERLFTVASRKYTQLDDGPCRTQRLKDIFSDAEVSDEFPSELFEKTADAVILENAESVVLLLMNGQQIR